MSDRAQAWVVQQRGLSLGERVVLSVLAFRADAHGVCWPGVEWIAERCEMEDRSVRRLLTTLAAKGLVAIEPQTLPSGRATSNRYVLALGSYPDSPVRVAHPDRPVEVDSPVRAGMTRESGLGGPVSQGDPDSPVRVTLTGESGLNSGAPERRDEEVTGEEPRTRACAREAAPQAAHEGKNGVAEGWAWVLADLAVDQHSARWLGQLDGAEPIALAAGVFLVQAATDEQFQFLTKRQPQALKLSLRTRFGPDVDLVVQPPAPAAVAGRSPP